MCSIHQCKWSLFWKIQFVCATSRMDEFIQFWQIMIYFRLPMRHLSLCSAHQLWSTDTTHDRRTTTQVQVAETSFLGESLLLLHINGISWGGSDSWSKCLVSAPFGYFLAKSQWEYLPFPSDLGMPLDPLDDLQREPGKKHACVSLLDLDKRKTMTKNSSGNILGCIYNQLKSSDPSSSFVSPQRFV